MFVIAVTGFMSRQEAVVVDWKVFWTAFCRALFDVCFSGLRVQANASETGIDSFKLHGEVPLRILLPEDEMTTPGRIVTVNGTELDTGKRLIEMPSKLTTTSTTFAHDNADDEMLPSLVTFR